MPQTFKKLSVVLSLLLLAPGAALAEDTVALEGASAARTELPRSLHLLEDLAEPAVTEKAPSSVDRVGAVALGALMGGSLAGLGGYALATRHCPSNDFGACPDHYLNIALGTALGAPLGAWLGGMHAGGSGTLWSAIGGAAAGGGIGILATLTLARGLGESAFLLVPVSTMVGSVLFYERSHAANVAEEAAAPAVQPLVSVSSRSAALGLSGRF